MNAYNDIPILMGDATPASTPPAECILVIDSGHSHTTITPVYTGRAIPTAVKRLDIGGKFLTNRLKELISLRHFGLMDDPYLAGQIKEDTCFVSQDFRRDLERTRKGNDVNDITIDYVLPDYHETTRGRVRAHDPKAAAQAAMAAAGSSLKVDAATEDFFPLANERFVVPELLFSPADVGMGQAGLAEAVVQSLTALPPGLWPGFLANIVVVGGNALLKGFVERLETELRPLVPVEMMLRIRCPDE